MFVSHLNGNHALGDAIISGINEPRTAPTSFSGNFIVPVFLERLGARDGRLARDYARSI